VSDSVVPITIAPPAFTVFASAFDGPPLPPPPLQAATSASGTASSSAVSVLARVLNEDSFLRAFAAPPRRRSAQMP
jgi:hypothetical protein